MGGEGRRLGTVPRHHWARARVPMLRVPMLRVPMLRVPMLRVPMLRVPMLRVPMLRVPMLRARGARHAVRREGGRPSSGGRLSLWLENMRRSFSLCRGGGIGCASRRGGPVSGPLTHRRHAGVVHTGPAARERGVAGKQAGGGTGEAGVG